MVRRRTRRRTTTNNHALDGDDLDFAVKTVTARLSKDHWIDLANGDVFAPHETQRVPKAGAWAMITRRLPPMEGGLDEQLRPGRVFYVQHMPNADDAGFLPGGTYKVKTDTPWGTVTLWPYEYTVKSADAMIALWTDGALVFHPMDVSAAQFNATVFYVRSRGIPTADAMVMALGSIHAPVGWFEPHPDVAPTIEGMIDPAADPRVGVGVVISADRRRMVAIPAAVRPDGRKERNMPTTKEWVYDGTFIATVQSWTDDKTYDIRRTKGLLTCDCGSFRFSKKPKHCKHLDAYFSSELMDQHELVKPDVRNVRVPSTGETFTIRRAISLGGLKP